jgi:type III secretory pathway component EscR
MEPQWTKKISNNTVCSWYYILFLINAFIAIVAVVGTLMVIFGMKMQKGMSYAFGFQGLLTVAIATTSSLFLYLVCDRSLLGEKEMKKEGFY